MLILTRKLGESIQIGDDCRITIIEVQGKQVRLGIEAPKEVTVYREEVYRMIQEQNLQAAHFAAADHESLANIWDKLRKKQ